MGKEKCSKISAAEARNLTEHTEKQFKWLYGSIREHAEAGINRLEWSIENLDPVVGEKMVEELRKSGYKVSKRFSENDGIPKLIISW